jgi:hypothetical protein
MNIIFLRRDFAGCEVFCDRLVGFLSPAEILLSYKALEILADKKSSLHGFVAAVNFTNILGIYIPPP